MGFKDVEDDVMKQVADAVISPVLVSYVWWVLTDAAKNGYKRLFFLARDGYIMCRLAEQFCVRFGLGIECRHLFGSRLAWRTALYSLIGDEKYRYIFAGGYLLTPKIILQRVLADEAQREKIYDDINRGVHTDSDRCDLANENRALNSKSMRIFAERLKKSKIFSEYLDCMSKRQFQAASAYLRQEGVFDGGDVVLVDSGWTGSIQRTLRQLAEHNAVSPNMTGYYFGLYERPSDPRDGRYEAWYFRPGSPVGKMTNFNNNVFECMCASPFEMTVGYVRSEGTGEYVPVFKEPGENGNNGNLERAKRLNFHIENFASGFLGGDEIDFGDYETDVHLKKSEKILRRFMINPTKKEAEAFGQFKFCDDASDSYENTLARRVDKKYLKNYNVCTRFFGKMTKKNINNNAVPDLFWFHGSLALSEIRHQAWHRLNYKIWESLRLLIKKFRKK